MQTSFDFFFVLKWNFKLFSHKNDGIPCLNLGRENSNAAFKPTVFTFYTCNSLPPHKHQKKKRGKNLITTEFHLSSLIA